MIELVVLGPATLQAQQVPKLRELLEKYGLPGFDEDSTSFEIWEKDRNEDIWFGCTHYEVDVFVFGASTKPEVKRFLVEAMKLAGVYDTCPEHNKRRFWKEQEDCINETELATPAPTPG